MPKLTYSFRSIRSPELVAQFPNAPLRKIVNSTPAWRRPGKRGLTSLSTFECGHQEWTQASERRRGKTYCFDCFYGKPVPEQGKITLDIIKERGT